MPTTISGAVMNELAYQALLFLNNYLQTSIGSNAIGDAHQSPLINLTKAWTLARMEGIGTDFSFTLGEFRVDKGNLTTNQQLIKTFFDTAMLEMKYIGRPFRFEKSNG